MNCHARTLRNASDSLQEVTGFAWLLKRQNLFEWLYGKLGIVCSHMTESSKVDSQKSEATTKKTGSNGRDRPEDTSLPGWWSRAYQGVISIYIQS